MKYIFIFALGLLSFNLCNAGPQGKGNGTVGPVIHNCIVYIREGGIAFGDIYGHVNDGQTSYNWHRYSVWIPQGVDSIHVQNHGGTGDVDLYVRNDGVPTEDIWNCRPYYDDNDEACLVDNLVSNTESYISLKVENVDYSGSDLAVHYNLPSVDNINRTEGFGWPAIPLLQAGLNKVFTIFVPDGLENLNINTSNGTGDPDLYMTSGGYNPLIKLADYPWISANNSHDAINIVNPSAGVYTIILHANTKISDVHLRVRYNRYAAGTGEVDPGSPLPAQSTVALIHNEWHLENFAELTKYFHIDVPDNKSWLKLSTHHWGGDMDLYVAKERIPTTNDYDCRSVNSGFIVGGFDDGDGYDEIANEECRLPVSGASRYYTMLTTYRERNFSQAKVLANYLSSAIKSERDGSGGLGSPWSIENYCSMHAPDMTAYEPNLQAYRLFENYETRELFCIPDGTSMDSSSNFRIRVPGTSFKLTIKTDHGTGDGNLYVNELANSVIWPNSVSHYGHQYIKDYTQNSTNSNNRECIEISATN